MISFLKPSAIDSKNGHMQDLHSCISEHFGHIFSSVIQSLWSSCHSSHLQYLWYPTVCGTRDSNQKDRHSKVSLYFLVWLPWMIIVRVVFLFDNIIMIANLFDITAADAMIVRICNLSPDAPRAWGTMTIDQMLEHCSRGIDMATGELVIPRVFIGRLLGWIFKKWILKDQPIWPGKPTAGELVTISDHFDVETEKTKLIAKIHQFTNTSPKQVAKSVHPFFWPLTAEQWGVQMWKHLDHHMRQFGG